MPPTSSPDSSPDASQDPLAPPRPWRRRAWQIGGGLVAGSAAVLAALWAGTPSADALAAVARAAPSRIVAADGTVLDTLGERLQQPVALKQVAPAFLQALLATEDRRFHEHAGLDPRRMLAALGSTLQGDVQGGSTLTQQLARNLFPEAIGRERSLLRKLREAVMALKIERAYDKEHILTLYVNHAPFLYNVVGVEMAAQTYFSKPARALEPAEAALLVALLKGPAQFDPQRAPERALERRNLVLALMQRDGHLSAREARRAQAQPLGLRLQRRDGAPAMAPHFVMQVRARAQAWAEEHGIDLARAGLTLHTPLDPRLQAVAEQAAARRGQELQARAAQAWTVHDRSAQPFNRLWREQPGLLRDAQARAAADKVSLARVQADLTRLEVGLVALDPRDGAVRAWVGARAWEDDRFDHVAQARRQPGSTFKPFVYGAALQRGLRSDDELLDVRPEIPTAEGTVWSPGDGGRETGEAMSLRTGLAQSRNTITAQVMQRVGPDAVVRFARQAGVEQAELTPVPSLALGTSDVSLLEMVRAYATLAAQGVRRQPVLLHRITDRNGRELARFESRPERTLSGPVTVELVDMLREVVDRGTGHALRERFGLRNDLAGKTGTTQRNADAWFIAMQPDLVVGSWVGFNDPRVTLRGGDWGHGGRSALLLTGDLLRGAQERKLVDRSLRFPQPPAPPPRAPALLVNAEPPAGGTRGARAGEAVDAAIDAIDAEEAERVLALRYPEAPQRDPR